jgi:hypothetical protein
MRSGFRNNRQAHEIRAEILPESRDEATESGMVCQGSAAEERAPLPMNRHREPKYQTVIKLMD